MEEILTSLKAKQVGDQKSLPTTGESVINAINGVNQSSETGSAAKDGVKLTVNDPMDQTQGRCGPGEFNKVTGKVDLSSTMHFTCSSAVSSQLSFKLATVVKFSFVKLTYGGISS